MLTDAEIRAMTAPMEALYEQLYEAVINDMARRIAKMDVSSASVSQMWRIRESGAVYENVLAELSKLTGKSEAELKRAFEKYGVKWLEFDDELYREAGLNPMPIRQSPAMLAVLEAGFRKTNGILKNLTMTTANTAQSAFIDAADLAYMEITSGAMSYQQAIRNAVLGVADKGLTVIDYASGRSYPMDAAMRRTVLTGVGQTAGNLQMSRAAEMGQDLVEVSAHIGARDRGVGPMNHASWQGKVYSISGKHSRYPSLVEVTGYGTAVGLYGINCRHDMYIFFPGISTRSYNNRQLDDMADQTVTYNGKEMSYYEGTQAQRKMERAIRKTKREAAALESAGLDNTNERILLGRQQATMRDFLDQTGLPRDRFREQVPGVSVRALKDNTASRALPTKTSTQDSTVSQALDIHTPINKNAVSEALAAIDEVHGDGSLPVIPLQERANLGKGVQGAFGFTGAGNPVHINLLATADHPRMTVVHETGHFIDFSAIGGKGKFAERKLKGVLSEWWDAIENSDAYKKWQDISARGGTLDANGVLEPVRKAFIDYSMEPAELWARSYAQFIATESTNAAMKIELSREIAYKLPNQWDPNDFAPISKAIYNILRGMGWKK